MNTTLEQWRGCLPLKLSPTGVPRVASRPGHCRSPGQSRRVGAVAKPRMGNVVKSSYKESHTSVPKKTGKESSGAAKAPSAESPAS